MDNSPQIRPGEVAFAFVCLAFALLAFWQSYDIAGFSTAISGGILPMVASGSMVGSGAIILIDSVRSRETKPPQERNFLSWLLPLRLLFMVALMIAYAVSIPKLGFFPSSALFLLVGIAILWRRPLLAIPVTIAVMAAIWTIFRVIFNVILPSGSIWT